MNNDKKINYINIWAVKAASRKKITETCTNHLLSLKFDNIYTPDYGLCLETVSQIHRILELGEVEVTLTERFRDDKHLKTYWDFFQEANLMKAVELWKKENPGELKEIQEKLKTAFQETIITLIRKLPKRLAYNILIVVDETVPLLEILSLKVDKNIKAMEPGEVTRIRLQINGDGKMEKIKLTPVHACQW